MHLGRSGAYFEFNTASGRVRKTHPKKSLESQANLLRKLGENICPRVYSVGDNWYSMEMLDPLSEEWKSHPFTLAQEIYRILRKQVWGRPHIHHNPSWIEDCLQYVIERDSELYKFLERLYSRVQFCLTHGDPTFANTMQRGDDLILIDPVPCRINVPSLPEMDCARIIQSLYGWENALDPNWPKPDHPSVLVTELFGPSELLLGRAYFWAAYNCLRILDHNTDAEANNWATCHYKLFVEQINACI